MNNEKRIKKAVKMLFDLDRKIDSMLEKFPPGLREDIDYPGTMDIAMLLLGMPEDNSCKHNDKTADEIDKLWEIGEYYCWDWFYDIWQREAKTAEEFISACETGKIEYDERRKKNQ